MTDDRIPSKPYMEEEFEEFLATLKGDAVYNWAEIARVIGVNKDTIMVWKQHPKAKEAIRQGIQEAMQGMKRAGKKDWKMWESKLKTLGISGIDKIDVTTDGEKIQPILGGQSNGIHSNDSDKEATPTPEKN